MTFPEITALSRHLDETDPENRSEHCHNVGRLRELCAFVREKSDPEVAACLEAAAGLIEVLAGPSERLDRRSIHDIACRLLGTVEQALRDLGVPTGGEAAPPAEKRAPLDLKLATRKPHAAAPAHAHQAPQRATPRADTALQPAPRPAAPRTAAPGPDAAQEQPAPPASTEPPQEQSAYEPKGDPALPRINNMVFGELMVQLGWSTREQVTRALDMHLKVGIPVGECLLVQGSATPERILEALKIQERMRSMSAPPEPQAPNAADAAGAATTPQALGLAPGEASILVTKQMFFGEVLLGMGMITKGQLEQAMRKHHFENVRVGRALVEMGALSEEDLNRGLDIQRSLLFAAGMPVDQADRPRHSQRRQS